MSSQSIHILIVDDDRELCDAISDLFRKFQFQVSSAYSAQEALTKIDQDHISIVISDVRMPDGDGFYLLEQIKKKGSEFPKVLFVSGSPVDMEKAYAMGIEGFFEKPFDSEQVKKAIKKCLMRKKDWWSVPVNTKSQRISMRFYDWDEMLKSQMVGFGKGGLFLATQKPVAAVNELVDFKMEFTSADPVRKIMGTGIVRWVRTEGDAEQAAGIWPLFMLLESPEKRLCSPGPRQNS
jgi:DNA-binding response OmpR family regulator